jgi:4-hydroxy-3-polyprenylbenzoate decarboxylase
LKIIVGITGTSGVIYGIRLIENLVKLDVETHLIISDTAKKIIEYETNYDIEKIKQMAHRSYDNRDLFAPPASGSFRHNGMIVVPCSLKTLSAIANGYADTLISRAAICTLKEDIKLILVPRETPLDRASIKNMLKAKENGATILPATPAFYHRPENIDEIIDFIVGKILDQLGIKHNLFKRWKENM